jgi:hypothetical protein
MAEPTKADKEVGLFHWNFGRRITYAHSADRLPQRWIRQSSLSPDTRPSFFPLFSQGQSELVAQKKNEKNKS